MRNGTEAKTGRIKIGRIATVDTGEFPRRNIATYRVKDIVFIAPDNALIVTAT
ncbi:MAG: hypothetical protein ACR2N3_14830 [Pyrinomonadaceae bacterium]